MKSDWKNLKLSEIVEFNPKESIKKGSIAKKVPMDKLRRYYRDIPQYIETTFSGGTKFRNGDTIMARITPCLENGKIAKVSILNENEVGFGSTEYIVFRAKKGISDPDYIYYLVCSPLVREPAIKSMVGSSGRQRVQIDVIQNLMIDVPSIDEQRKIGALLKALDDKIALNYEINDNLSEQVQAIYCDNYSLIAHTPSGVLSDICHYSIDKVPVSTLSVSTYYSTENILPNKAGTVDATSLPSIPQTTKCHKGDVLVSNIRPYFKKIVYVTNDCGCSTDVLCFSPKENNLSAFLFGTLYVDRFFDYMVAGSKGTKMPRGDKQQIMNYPIVIPSEKSIDIYNKTVIPMLTQIACNQVENKRLTDLRDSLLPKLMSGEIEISNVHFGEVKS